MNFLGDTIFFMKLPTECMNDVEIHEISFANIHDCDSWLLWFYIFPQFDIRLQAEYKF